jgi:hypothetical protein
MTILLVSTVLECLDEVRDQDSKYRDQDGEAQDKASKILSRVGVLRFPFTGSSLLSWCVVRWDIRYAYALYQPHGAA